MKAAMNDMLDSHRFSEVRICSPVHYRSGALWSGTKGPTSWLGRGEATESANGEAADEALAELTSDAVVDDLEA